MGLIHFVFLTDLHLGNPRVAAREIADDVRDFVFEKIKGKHIFLFGGDFFDQLIDLDNAASSEALCLASDILSVCWEEGVFVRILQGTFQHDRRQLSAIFNTHTYHDKYINEDKFLKVYTGLDIEYIKTLGISVLYQPDDLPHNDILGSIRNTVKNNGYKSADIMLRHGYVQHMLPYAIRTKYANIPSVTDLSKLVRGPILSGHIHIPSTRKKYISGGSFTRLAHGEPEAKGFHTGVYNKETHETTLEFHPNPRAAPFITLPSPEEDGPEDHRALLVDQVKSLNQKFPEDRTLYLRAYTDSSDVRQHLRDYSGKNWGTRVKLTFERLTKNQQNESLSLSDYTLEEKDPITPDNLSTKIAESLNDGTTADQIEEVFKLEY